MASIAFTYRAVAAALEQVPASLERMLPAAREAILSEAAAVGYAPEQYLAELHAREAVQARAAAAHVDLYGENSPLPASLR